MAKTQLTGKKKKFVESYVENNFDATKAAIAAGYSKKTAAPQASRLLNDPQVKSYLEAIQGENSKTHKKLRERVIDELALMAFSNMQDYVIEGERDFIHPKDLTREQAAAIESIQWRETKDGRIVTTLKLASKNSALELLGRHFGLWTDKVQHILPQPTVIRRKNGEEIVLGAVFTEQGGPSPD